MTTEELVQHPKRFIPAWENAWTPPAGMLDFEEKWEAFHTPGGRVMACAHRGDVNLIYPENSLEGILSVILAGTDMVEVDVHTAADGTLVVMHDDTLTRTTNLLQLRAAGQDRGLPESNAIRDWTFEQIRTLRLMGKDGQVTACAVPALREVIALAKDRVFVTLDKWGDFDWDTGVYPLIRDLRAYHTVLIPYGYPTERAHAIQRTMFEQVGAACPFFADAVNNGVMAPEKIHKAMQQLGEYGMPKALRGGEYVPEEVEQLEPTMAQVRGKYRIYAETLRKPHDNEEHWTQMADLQYNIIMGNRIYDLLRFVARRYFA